MAQDRNHLRLHLVFSGECLPGHDPLVVRRAVTAALRLHERHTARLFSGKHIVLKRQVDAAFAARQVARFAALGAVLRTQIAPPPEPRPPRFSAKLAGLLSQPPRRATLAVAAVAVVTLVLVGVWWAGQGSGPGWASGPVPVAAPTTSQAAPAPLPSPVADADLPRLLSAQATIDYRQQYWPAPWHKAFAVAASGSHVWVVGLASPLLAREQALLRCAKAQPAAAAGCRVVDVDGEPQD